MCNSGPLISVIVPVWNAHNYLERCIDSIISQTYRNLEILLVDDGSSDDSLEICRRYERKDTRIKAFHKENGGQGSARNFALDHCSGQYVGFVDNDDWILPTMYERLLELICKYKVNVSRCDDAQSKEEIGQGKRDEIFLSKEEFHKDFFCDIVGGHVTDRLFDRDLIKAYRFPHSKTIEDTRFIRQLLPDINGEAFTREKLYFYTAREDNTSNKYARTYISSFERAIEYQSRYEEAIHLFPSYKDLLLQKSTTFSCGCLRILLKSKSKNSSDFEKLVGFLRKYKGEIWKNNTVSWKYKLFILTL